MDSMPDTETPADLLAVLLENVQLTLPSEAGDVHILRGIDLRVPQGEAVGIVGPSGGGKSTMMMVIAGLERASRGTVETAGVDLMPLSEDSLALFRRETVGIVFQDFHLIPTMTALENVAVPLEFRVGRSAIGLLRGATATRSCRARPPFVHYPGQLSGSEQQRVALARAYAGEPKILLADEPTGNLDRETGEVVMDLLFDLHGRAGTTMLLISHDPVLAERCDRVVTLADGRIAGDRQTVE